MAARMHAEAATTWDDGWSSHSCHDSLVQKYASQGMPGVFLCAHLGNLDTWGLNNVLPYYQDSGDYTAAKLCPI